VSYCPKGILDSAMHAFADHIGLWIFSHGRSWSHAIVVLYGLKEVAESTQPALAWE
jgi:hypothetical protein